jgi:hypothetical protein
VKFYLSRLTIDISILLSYQALRPFLPDAPQILHHAFTHTHAVKRLRASIKGSKSARGYVGTSRREHLMVSTSRSSANQERRGPAKNILAMFNSALAMNMETGLWILLHHLSDSSLSRDVGR